MALLLALAGCGSSALPAGGCDGLGETDCANANGCAVLTCNPCGGGPTFARCYDASQARPACPGYACKLPCAMENEAGCLQRTDCRTDYCPTCSGGKTFVDCANPTDPQIGCGLDCPAPACSQFGDPTTCNAQPNCHAVFQPAGACGCAPAGCCIHFDHCAEGKANCTGPVACEIPSPICDGPYVNSYTNVCYEGCVLQSECM